MNIKSWRSNYVVTYLGYPQPDLFRGNILSVLTGLANIYKIEMLSEFGSSLFGDTVLSFGKDQIRTVRDLFYFRSTSETPISGRDFRKIVDDCFRQGWIPFEDGPDRGFQMQKYIHEVPFPANA